MSLFYSILRFILQFLLLLVYSSYTGEVLSLSFLLSAFIIAFAATVFLEKTRLRTLPALILLSFLPWIIRLGIIAVQQWNRSFLQISFDGNFYFSLPVLYWTVLTGWFAGRFSSFRKYEVLINGILLFLLFLPQENYKVTIVPEPAWLAPGAVIFLLIELLLLYLATALERGYTGSPGRAARETIPFYLLLLPLVIYLLFPLWKEYEEGSVAGGGGLLKSSLFRFDFSEYIKLETEISMSDDLVLMFRKEGPAERLLLRRYVLSGYEDKKGFFRVDRDKTDPPDTVPTRYREYGEKEWRNREKVSQELFLVNIDPSALLSLNYPVDVQPVYNWDDSSFVRIYRSEAMVNTIPLREADPSTEMDEEELKHYTYTGGDEDIARLADDVAGDIPGTYLKALAIEDYLRNNYYYSLKPGVSPDGDQLGWFLHESKKGYCSYFAFSMALLCRSLGIPARVAVGFWVDPDVSVLNFYPVRADQAHAWVEVYFRDYGWIEFDPTSSTMYPGEQYPFAGFSIEEFSPLIEEILDNQMVPENLAQTEVAPGEDEKAGAGQVLIRLAEKTWYWFVLILWMIYIAGHHFLHSLAALVRKDPRRKAAGLYGEARMKLSFERKHYRESLMAYAGRIEKLFAIPFAELTELYQKSRYSQHFSREDLSKMMDVRKKTIAAYRENIPRWKRFIHFLFPFVRGLHL